MAVIRETQSRPSTRQAKRPHLAYRLLNVLFSTAAAAGYVGLAAYFIVGGVDGFLPEKISAFFVGATAIFGAVLMVRQALKDSNPISLVTVLGIAAGFAWLIQFGAESILTDNAQLSRLRRPMIIDAAIFYGAAYLMIWERGVRTDIGSDDVVDVFRSISCMWPMFLYIALLLAVEFLIW